MTNKIGTHITYIDINGSFKTLRPIDEGSLDPKFQFTEKGFIVGLVYRGRRANSFHLEPLEQYYCLNAPPINTTKMAFGRADRLIEMSRTEITVEGTIL